MDELEKLRARVDALETIVADMYGLLFKQAPHEAQMGLLKIQEAGLDGPFRLKPRATDYEEARHSAALDIYAKVIRRF